ncbi:MAG: S-layer homology domain-containing protein [Clostridiales bacterium]|nr:S-layer homology domain-containing protein [Clostridiales bacterium]
MMLSVMVMGAGAAFTDQDKIVNEEAVDMISALGIVDGYEDDSFQPEKNIERGEAAKMIAVMLNGGKDAVQDTSVSSFNDVLGSADAWANKYIEYGVSKAILAGVGGDRFAPASNVTGTQLAKMLLVSLGYDADKEGYLDDTSWAVNVNADAASAGLYAGVESIDMNAALTRDNAAQMIWNALQANTVKYSILGGLTETSTTLLQKAFGKDHDTTTGILTDIFYNQDTKVYTYTVNACDSSAKLTDEDGIQFKSTVDYSDLFAMNVKVLYDDNNALCIRTDKGGVVVEGVWGDIDDVWNAHFNTITVDGQKYTLDNVAKDMDELWDSTCGYNRYGQLNERYTGAYTDPDIDRYGLRNSDPKFEPHVQYSFVGIDQDGGGDIDVFVVYPYVVLRSDRTLTNSFQTNVIEWDDASMVVANTNSYWAQDYGLMRDLGIRVSNRTGSNVVEYDDVLVNGTVAENGYVMGVPAQYTATGIDTYTVLDIQSAAATSLNSADRMITLGNTEYDGTLLDWINPVSTISLGETYAFVEVNGYLFIVDGNSIAPVTDEYVVVTKTALAPQGADKLWETEILKTDGTTETVNVYVSMNDQHVGPEVGSLYTVRTDLDGNYELIAVPYGTKTADSEVTNFDVQQAYKNGATLNNELNAVWSNPGHWEYEAQYVGRVDAATNNIYDAAGNQIQNSFTTEDYNLAIELTSTVTNGNVVYYNITGVKDGVSPVQYEASRVSGTTGDVALNANGYDLYAGTYYYAIKATWIEPSGFGWEVVNPGTVNMYTDDPTLAFYKFNDMTSSADTNSRYYIEDDAVIFVYNRMMDEYSVVSGADLASLDVNEVVTWAFTGATAKVVNGTPTVDLGYVAVNNDPDETLVYAYVNSNPIRTLNENGNHILVVDVMLENGETVTLTSKEYANENDSDLMRLYNALRPEDRTANGIYQLIVDGSTLVDIKDYNPADSYTVEAKLYNGVIKLKDKAGVTKDYFVSTDTVFIPADGEVESIADIVKGATINAVIDGDDVLAVIY